MIIQHCYEPLELKILHQLEPRMKLSITEKQQLFSLKKGFAGEKKFEEEWLTKLTCECMILNDLLLEYNGNIFQIDSLIITQKTIYLFDVKNFEEDFYIQDNIWRRLKSDREIKDPLLQLNRCKSLFRRLLQDLHYHLPVEANLLFINPHFTLYQVPIDVPIIHPSQIERTMNNIDTTPSVLNATHTKLVDQLLARQVSDSLYARIPTYEYDSLKKGIPCVKCHSFMVISPNNDRELVCLQCGLVENFRSGVSRTIREYELLFKEQKETTNTIYDWCGGIGKKRRIRRILNNQYKIQGHGKYAYYVQDER